MLQSMGLQRVRHDWVTELTDNMNPSMIQALKLKQMVEGLEPQRNILREMKNQKVRHKLLCISVKLHKVCLPFLSPLPPPPLLASTSATLR